MVKNIIIVAAIIFAFNTVNAQKLNTVKTYDMSTTIEESKKSFRASLHVSDSLILKDGSVVQVGDTVACGESSNNTGNDYQTIIIGKYTGMSAPVFAQPLTSVNRVIIIESLKVVRSMGGITCWVYLRDVNAKGLKMHTHLTGTNISFESGELINPKAPMSKKEAIAALKESKDLFDLGLMTQEEYNRIKSKLTPIIMNK